MRLHRFYIQTELSVDTEIVVDDTEHLHQWVSVFRFATDDSIILFNGDGNDYTGTFTEVHKKKAVIQITSVTPSLVMKHIAPVHLYLSLIKKDLFELVVEKATELGVSSITPIITERTQNKNLNMDRLEKITIEASEQSGRGDVPQIHSAVSLTTALEATKGYSQILTQMGGQDPIKNSSNLSQALFIGPEGGWGEKDLEQFTHYTVQHVSLGETTLRAETAAIVGCFMLLK
ncbi:MAG: hypothetical protein RLY57_691 [Candidatus Parcubacteria bacterium]|jgi:16S rRNA (uracil1498-N3)-methyltransferase